MHESAFRIGELVMQTYCDLPKARILEIGSMDINGSLRDFAQPTTHYVGVDLEEGPGVDVVVKPGAKLPFEDFSFDLIMASSAFEHDPRFWETFVEMCRVTRRGGHIYVNAPSNGGVHRYPLDCWRFYPDAGVALTEYAHNHEIQLDLVESFVGKRYPDTWDGWNDFVAIFRLGPTRAKLNRNFIYKRYPCNNVRTWDSQKMDFENSITEDMQLVKDLREQVVSLNNDTERLQNERRDAEKIEAGLIADLRIAESELSQLRSAASSLEQQVQALSSALQAQTETLTAALSDAREKSAQFERERFEAERTRDVLTAELRIAQSEASNLRSTSQSLEQQILALSKSQRAQSDAFARVQERDLSAISALEAELTKLRADHLSLVENTSAELSRLRVREAELDALIKTENAQHQRHRSGIEWLRAIHIAMTGRPHWWFLLSKQSRRAREYEMLREVGLFDDQSYLMRHPDVAAAGMNPLDHYIAHGMSEGRERG